MNNPVDSEPQSEQTRQSEQLLRIQQAMSVLSGVTSLDKEAADTTQQDSLEVKAQRTVAAIKAISENYRGLQTATVGETTEVPAVTPLTEVQKQLINQHLGLINSVVFQVSAGFPRHVERDELAASGTLGLIESATRFDPNAGTDFAVYATQRIRGAILDHVRSEDWVPRSVRRQQRQIEDAKQRLTSVNGQAPTDRELAEELELPTADIIALRNKIFTGVNLSLEFSVSSDEDDITLLDTLTDRRELDPLLHLEEREDLSFLKDAIAVLPERHRYVVEAYFLKGMVSAAIAEELRVTESRVSQIRSEAITMLRYAIQAQYKEDTVTDGDTKNISLLESRRQEYASRVAKNTVWKQRLAQ